MDLNINGNEWVVSQNRFKIVGSWWLNLNDPHINSQHDYFEIDSGSITNIETDEMISTHDTQSNAQNTSERSHSDVKKSCIFFGVFLHISILEDVGWVPVRFSHSSFSYVCLFSEILVLPIALRHFITSSVLRSSRTSVYAYMCVCMPFKSPQSKRNERNKVCFIYGRVISRACVLFYLSSVVLRYFVLKHSVCKSCWHWNNFGRSPVWDTSRYLWN